jgi:hypothetical protein
MFMKYLKLIQISTKPGYSTSPSSTQANEGTSNTIQPWEDDMPSANRTNLHPKTRELRLLKVKSADKKACE